MPSPATPVRRLAAVWFADLVGYTRLSSQNEPAALRLVNLFQEATREQVQGFSGRVVKFIGDGTLAEFTSTDSAVRCALALQRELAARSAAAGLPGMLRIGVHVGDVVGAPDGDIYGDGVNVAARLQGEAEPGQVLVSEDVWHHLRARPEFRFTALGERELRGVTARVAVFGVEVDEGVEGETPAFIAAPVGTQPARPDELPGRSPWRWSPGRAGALLGGGVVAALLILAFLVATGREDTEDPPPTGAAEDTSPDRSIAVLPFTNLSADPQNEYFSDGITEDILTNLSRIGDLRVISRTSVMQYKGTTKSLRTIGEELGVAFVLEGSVRRDGEQVRITAQLIHAPTDRHLWAETYDRELRAIFAIQSEVAEQIADALAAGISPEEKARIAAAPTTNLAAYDYYLLGRDHWNRRTVEGFAKAMEYFQQAIENDSSFALAYAGLADTHLMHASWSLRPHFEAVPQAKQVALRAVELDSTRAEIHTSLAQVYVMEWDWLAADRSFRRAVALNPNYAIARHWYGQFLTYMARYDEAIPIAESARSLDPLSPIINADLGHVYLEARRYREGEAQFLRTLELHPGSRIALTGLAQTYERTGRVAEALRAYLRLQQLQGFPSFYLAAFHARQGRREEGRRLLRASIEQQESRGFYIRPAQVARVLVALGEFDEAFTWLEKGYVERDSFMVLLQDSPDFDPVRADPRFADLKRRMNFPEPAHPR